jgi:superfamily I DNA/RNA helicase
METQMSTVEVVKPAYKPSKQQAAVFQWTLEGEGSAIVSAVAGAGKTTTLTRAMGLMSGRVAFTSFGNKIVKEIKHKVEELGLARNDLHISTMHSMGLKVWMKSFPKSKVEPTKVTKIIDMFLLTNPDEYEVFRPHRAFVRKLVMFGKNHLIGVGKRPAMNNLVVWEKLMKHYSLDESLPEFMTDDKGQIVLDANKVPVPYDVKPLLAFVAEVFEKSAKMCPIQIDQGDMLYAPLFYNVKVDRYNFVVLDEAQDTNPAQRELAVRMLLPGGRFLGCGDENQAIFGFAGAGTNSMELLSKEFKAKRLELSITYRCPKAVVNYVKQWVPRIEAAETAPEGKLGFINSLAKDANWFDGILPTDAVVCRYTAPLVANAFELIRKGIPCKVEGRDIGSNLVAMVNRFGKVKTLDGLETKLKKYLETEIEKAEKAEDDARKEQAEDIFGTIMIFVEKCRAARKTSVDDLIAEIEALFADNVEGITTFCTGHKSKGREWKRVFWLDTALRSRRILKDWEVEQENNLCYVMGTRAMDELYIVSENIHSPQKVKK